eukprot:m.101032 g.101032  ORF g.101032 m.101032 type:complete len:964 (+) comp27298_c0_seq1:272-3163(+)
MEQFDQVVRLLQSPDTDDNTKTQALGFLNQVVNSEGGWVACAQWFSSNSFSFEATRFQCLVVIEHALKHQFVSMTAEHKRTMKEFLLTWLSQCTETNVDRPHIRNKMAQLVALAFIHEFPNNWPTFFGDITAFIATAGPTFLDIFFRILTTIHELIVDREISRSPDELARNNDTKDAMRVNGINVIVDTWHHCLTTCATTHPSIAVACLDSMGKYVSWIDIGHVVNDRFIPLLFKYPTTNTQLREESLNCIREIVLKGMDAISKTRLISSLNLIEFVVMLFQSQHEEDDENEFMIALARLCNAIGLQLISSAQDLEGEPDKLAETLRPLEGTLPLLCGVLANDYDDISQEVLPFAQNYIQYIKGKPLSQDRRENITKLLQTVMQKMRYDDDFNHSDHNDDEIDFLDYRRNLQILFDNIKLLDQELFLSVTIAFVTNILGKLGVMNIHYHDVELALHIAYLVGPLFDHKASPNVSASIVEMMVVVTNGAAMQYTQQAVALKYCEVCVRLGKFFTIRPDRLPDTAAFFLGPAGVKAASGHVRSRTCYAFLRLVKAHARDLLQPYLPSIMESLQPVCLAEDGFLGKDDQLFLYEAMGLLVTGKGLAHGKCHQLFDALISPLLEKYTTILQKDVFLAKDEEEQELVAERLKHIILMITSSSKAFTKASQLRSTQCDQILARALQTFVESLQIQIPKSKLRSGICTYLHRMIVCMGEAILPFIPVAVSTLFDLNSCQLEDLEEVIPLINQIVAKFKDKVGPMLDAIFIPVIKATFSILNQSVEENDLYTKQSLTQLRRYYYDFLGFLIIHDLSGVLTSEKNAPYSGQLLSTIVQGAMEVSDAKGQKVCFSMLRNLIKLWFRSQTSGVPGFDAYVFSHIIPCCFESILRPTFDPDDAWSYLVLNEIADVLITTNKVADGAFIQFLEGTYFRNIQMPPQSSAPLLELIQKGQKKPLSQCLMRLSKDLVPR